ncbi:bifunctional folylpolyglutamate synthase/dihydrofolate synthase [Sphingomonas aerolata]|uniref:bifunctional folylpolyglutamate synthase/dihydrofolate synthase n=1 Tax=Sphingomonas aerolata TaxID=185951 RepID=UPI002FE26864
MPDHATSLSPAVQAQLDRLTALSPGADILGLERITALLSRLGDPHLSLPPVFHVAGTNGKGSTCAFLRAAMEAAGLDVHVYSSPHLVRFNERIRLAGQLIDDDALAALLSEVLDHAADLQASFFEVTTAAAFLAFARTPAAATIVEVGLGGRLDATNVIPNPVVTGIAALGIDHQAFLGDTLLAIAGEKAGIAKRGVPLVTMDYARPLRARIAGIAEAAGAPVLARGTAWTSEDDAHHDALHRCGRHARHQPPAAGRPAPVAQPRARDRDAGGISRRSPSPTRRCAPPQTPRTGPRGCSGCPTARSMQRLPAGSDLWLDGAHESQRRTAGRARAADAGGRPSRHARARHARQQGCGRGARHSRPAGRPRRRASRSGSCASRPRRAGGDRPTHRVQRGDRRDPAEALDRIAAQGDAPQFVLIAGSLYLAGEVLAANDELPH